MSTVISDLCKYGMILMTTKSKNEKNQKSSKNENSKQQRQQHHAKQQKHQPTLNGIRNSNNNRAVIFLLLLGFRGRWRCGKSRAGSRLDWPQLLPLLNFVREREERERARRATMIQRRYRGVLGRRKARRQGVEVAKRRKMELTASRKIQQRYRMYRSVGGRTVPWLFWSGAGYPPTYTHVRYRVRGRGERRNNSTT